MKKSFFILLLFISIQTYSQTPFFYTQVVNVDSTATKAELFSRARACLSQVFVNSKVALDVQDKEAGELIGNGSADVFIESGGFTMQYGYVAFSFKILVKDGRYKYEFSNFIHKQTRTDAGYVSYGLLTDDDEAPEGIKCFMCGKKLNNRTWNQVKVSLQDKMVVLITVLKKSMSESVAGKSDW